MDFAKKQLEKFGWKDGDGLGKERKGITVAIKPHLKTGKEGMGFDLSQELTDTWWTRAYSDSLSRINVNAEGDEVDVNLVDEDASADAEDTKGRKRKAKNNVPGYTDELRPMDKMRRRMLKANFTTFSKGGTLSNGEINKEECSSDSDANEEIKSVASYKVLTDEELFKVCGGRTLHKAARFGHKLSGKLARIAAQEQSGASVATLDSDGFKKRKKTKTSSATLDSDSSKKKKKNKTSSATLESVESESPKKKKKNKTSSATLDSDSSKKKKKK